MSCFKFAMTLSLTFFLVGMVVNADDNDWTRFRGPGGKGIAKDAKIADSWTESSNVKWKVDLPGPGSSCPIVHGDYVYLTCYTGYGVDRKDPGQAKDLKRHLLCFELKSGKEVWRTTVDSAADEDPYKGFIMEHGYASSTPVTNGKRIFTFFSKSGVCAFDMKGKKIWQTSVGTKSDPYKWGGGSSPILYKDLVIVNAGNVGRKIVALSQSDGKEKWSMENDKFQNCWGTPIVVKTDKGSELVTSQPGQIVGIDPETGKKLWSCKSPIAQTVCSSLVERNGVVFAQGGRQGKAIAVKCGGKGDVTNSHVVWTKAVASSIGTPIIFDDKILWSGRGVVFCYQCSDGKELFKARLPAVKVEGQAQRRGPAGDYASPIKVGDKILVSMRSGATHVLKAGAKYELVSTNLIKEASPLFNATPAISGDKMLIRSQKKLYCISK